jgi:hypothetical protein
MVALGSTLIDTAKFGSNDVTAFYLGSNEAWTANKPGMVLMKATSIDYSGTSATLGENGQVTFSAVTSLSLNGVFTAEFDNYVVSMNHYAAATTAVYWRFLLSGSDASGSDYTRQLLRADSTTVAGVRESSNTSQRTMNSDPNYSGCVIHFYGPALAQPTAHRDVSANSLNGARIYEYAGTHSVSTAYDGIRFFTDENWTGKLAVYGVRS